MLKKDIRRLLLATREAQSVEEKRKKDEAIFKKITDMEVFQSCREFFTYIPHRGEVSTTALINAYFKKKKILVPKIDGEEICLYELKNPTAFEKGTFGVPEPSHCVPQTEFARIDVAFVPGIAFDARGHRIGFGGGYFDRFLKKIHCTTIGLAYEFQMIDNVPIETYDVPVDWIVTERRIINCTTS